MCADNPIDTISAKIKQRQFSEAKALAEALLATDSANVRAWQLKAMALVHLGDGMGAIACYSKALQYKPDFKEAAFDLACTLDKIGKFDLAVKAYAHWLKIEQLQGSSKPVALSAAQRKTLEEWFFKGEDYQKHGDSGKAAAAYRKVLEIDPDMPEALTNLANALFYLQEYKEAEQHLLHCLRVKSGHADALNTLGLLYKNTQHYARAVAAYEQALAAHPRYLPSLINLGNINYEMKRYGQSVELYKRILAIDPDNTDVLCHLVHLLYRFCDWTEVEKRKASMRERILQHQQYMAPQIVNTIFDSNDIQLKNALEYTAKTYPLGKTYDVSAVRQRTTGNLRLGYLSADFFDHATLHLISELFERHDKEKFEIHAYSYGPQDRSMLSNRIRNSVHHFSDVRSLSDAAVAQRIAQDGIDILVDLKGYTKDHRLGILASRPAPVQLHYLGFPATTGAPFIDYFITDAIASPPGAEAAFSERLIRLPHSYQMNDRKRPLPMEALPRTSYGLPETGFVFCDFNNSYKITPEIFAVWMRLLKAVEGSVLWLYETHPEATVNLESAAKEQGVDPARIIMAHAEPQATHLPRYLHADLVIDTFPVCGHTTTSDALWCGVPVLAMAGETFISRVAASLLHAVGLPELVASDIHAYEAMALELACGKERLLQLRQHLQQGRMQFPLFDSAATTRALEAAYVHMLERHRAGAAPQPFQVFPDLHCEND